MYTPTSSESCCAFLFIIGVTFGGGYGITAILGLESGNSTAWYDGLKKPSWTPPDSVFAPVWAVLYFLMALAAFLVWKRGGFLKQALPLSLYSVQLVLNFSWVLIFQEARQLLAAFVEICVLWVAIVLTAILFWRVKKFAGFLLIPYALWVGFAGSLNYEFWRLNKD